jgi:hypothetical protein
MASPRTILALGKRYTRESWKAERGTELPPFNPSEPAHDWAWEGVINSGAYQYYSESGEKVPMLFTQMIPYSMKLSVPNIPGGSYKPLVHAPTNHHTLQGPDLQPVCISAEDLMTPMEAAGLVADLKAAGWKVTQVSINEVSGFASIQYDPNDPRRIFTAIIDSPASSFESYAPTTLALLRNRAAALGVGYPGRWSRPAESPAPQFMPQPPGDVFGMTNTTTLPMPERVLTTTERWVRIALTGTWQVLDTAGAVKTADTPSGESASTTSSLEKRLSTLEAQVAQLLAR